MPGNQKHVHHIINGWKYDDDKNRQFDAKRFITYNYLRL